MFGKLLAFSKWLVVFGVLLAACRPAGSPTAPAAQPPAEATPGAGSAAPGGPVEIRGGFTYSNDVITRYFVEHAVALTDMYGFVIRDREWELPVDAQALGFLEIDPGAQTGTYTLDLPARPDGTLADVDNDGSADAGVQIFAVAYSPNVAGGPFSEGDDRSMGWPTYLASVKTDTENDDEVIGGKLVVWAPDEGQQFPTGFGDDGLLFTADDPAGPIPAGYSIVDLDQSPFAISREAEPEVELHEPQDAAIKDYSGMSYTEAFEALHQKVSTEWAFNGIPDKEVDWQALHDRLAPKVAEAEKNGDPLAFYRALHEFAISIPDGHTGIGGEIGDQDFVQSTSAGYGFAIRELDDGRAIVVFVTPGGPAEAAGMQVGAEVTHLNGQPIGEAIGSAVPYGSYSTEIFRRYQQARYLLRVPEGAKATVAFVNPGGAPQTVELSAVNERESFAYTSLFFGVEPKLLPVDSSLLESGIGYISINSYSDDLNLTVRLFQRALDQFQAAGISKLIIDLRHNGGGNPLGLAGFLYDQEIPLGQQESYSEKTGKFEPVGIRGKVLPNVQQYRFEGVALLVGQACASACEEEAYSFSKVPGTVVVGMYPTSGAFADVLRGQFLLPEGLQMQTPTERFTNPDGGLFLEGTGVVPTVKVPVTAETVLSTDDVELRAAEDALMGVGSGGFKTEAGLMLGSRASAQLAVDSGAQLLDSVARERYAPGELSQAGRTYTYTVGLTREERLIWAVGWCASSPEALAENYRHMTFEFSVNGSVVPLDTFGVAEGQNAMNRYCKLYYTVAYRWPHGETHLGTRVTFDAPIADGQSTYPAGTHRYDYVVTLP